MEKHGHQGQKKRYIYIFGNTAVPNIMKSNTLRTERVHNANVIIDTKYNIIVKNRYGKTGDIEDDDMKMESIGFHQGQSDDKSDGTGCIASKIHDINIKDSDMIAKQLENNKFEIDDKLFRISDNKKFKIVSFEKQLNSRKYIYHLVDNRNSNNWYDEEYIQKNFRKLKYGLFEYVYFNKSLYASIEYEIIGFDPSLEKDYIIRESISAIDENQELHVNEEDIRLVDDDFCGEV